MHLHTRAAGNPHDWSVKDVSQWLRLKKFTKCVASFEENDIDGAQLAQGLDDTTLILLGANSGAERKRLQAEIGSLFP